MYDHSSALIVSILLAGLVVATEAGYRLGHRFVNNTTDATKSQINTVQGSLLGVLALLIGFTFSQSLQRYDSRSEAVVNEANAIGTTVLRAGLVPVDLRAQTQTLLQDYLDLRIETGTISLDRVEERSGLLRDSDQLLNSLWQLALQAAQSDPNPVTTGLFIQSLNDLIDLYSIRAAALNRHVPEVVLFLLFGTFTFTVSLVGFASGIAGQRAFIPTYLLVTLIALLVFVIIDLDRPRRGLIEVSQNSLVELKASSQPGGSEP